MNQKTDNPLARKDDLVVREMPDEVLVYDLKQHKAHCLNPMAAFVWNHCDGQTTAAGIAGLMTKKWQASVDENVVWIALKQLEKANLLQEQIAKPEGGTRFSRREAMRRMGLAAAVTLPLVTSIIAPAAAATASGCVLDFCVSKGSDPTACNGCNATQTGKCYTNNGCGGPEIPGAICLACFSDPAAKSWKCISGC